MIAWLARTRPLVAVTALLSALAGLVSGWSFWSAGFPLIALSRVLVAAGVALGCCLAFLLMSGAAYRFLAARFAEPRARLAALVLTAVPWMLLAGYAWNIWLGLRPADLTTAYGLKWNALLLLLAAAVLGTAYAVSGRDVDEEPSARRTLSWYAAALGLAAVAFLGSSWIFRLPRNESVATPVFVLLIDALRADRLSVYGNVNPTTPEIDRFARDGIVFDQAIAQSTFTKTSVASLFTGRNPFEHGVYWGSSREHAGQVSSDLLPEEETTLAEALRAKGYLTTAWIQNSHLRSFMGFAQGFIDYRDQIGGAARIHRQLLPWLAGPGRRYGFFSYVHYIDLHDPYAPPPPFDRMFGGDPSVYDGIDLSEWGAHLERVRRGEVRLSAEDIRKLYGLYDGQLHAVDREIGRLFATLREQGLYDRSLIVVLADHGDGFGEHGFIAHSTTPYDELLHVPLIVKLPGGRHAGTRVAQQVRLIDIFPTLLDVLGSRVQADVSGCSLLPLLEPDRPPRPPGCDEALAEIAEEGAAPTVAVRTGRYKYIYFERKPGELYDLLTDPGETKNLASELPDVVEPLRQRALYVTAHRKVLSDKLELDDRTIRELKGLGYLR